MFTHKLCNLKVVIDRKAAGTSLCIINFSSWSLATMDAVVLESRGGGSHIIAILSIVFRLKPTPIVCMACIWVGTSMTSSQHQCRIISPSTLAVTFISVMWCTSHLTPRPPSVTFSAHWSRAARMTRSVIISNVRTFISSGYYGVRIYLKRC